VKQTETISFVSSKSGSVKIRMAHRRHSSGERDREEAVGAAQYRSRIVTPALATGSKAAILENFESHASADGKFRYRPLGLKCLIEDYDGPKLPSAADHYSLAIPRITVSW